MAFGKALIVMMYGITLASVNGSFVSVLSDGDGYPGPCVSDRIDNSKLIQ